MEKRMVTIEEEFKKGKSVSPFSGSYSNEWNPLADAPSELLPAINSHKSVGAIGEGVKKKQMMQDHGNNSSQVSEGKEPATNEINKREDTSSKESLHNSQICENGQHIYSKPMLLSLKPILSQVKQRQSKQGRERSEFQQKKQPKSNKSTPRRGQIRNEEICKTIEPVHTIIAKLEKIQQQRAQQAQNVSQIHPTTQFGGLLIHDDD